MKVRTRTWNDGFWSCFAGCGRNAEYELRFNDAEMQKYNIRYRYNTLPNAILLCEKHYKAFLADKPELIYDII